MTFDEYFKTRVGKGIDYDGSYGVQCFDLANDYAVKVLGGKQFIGMWAYEIYTNYASQPSKALFEKIANTPSFVPKKGDIVVWSKTLNGRAGHVAVCTGEGNTSYFYSYDQNWAGRNDPVTLVKHSYDHVLGVLRPKDQAKVLGTAAGALTFVPGTYDLTVDLKVRTGAGTTYAQKKRSQLTKDGQKHSYPQTLAVLYNGTRVTVSKVVKRFATEFWGKIPSGWICLMQAGKSYVKKVK